MKASRSDAAIKAILAVTFPRYAGRKIAVEPQCYPLDTRTNGDGGSFSDFVMIDLATLRAQDVPLNGDPWDTTRPSVGGIRIPLGFAVVEHAHFCGSDLGIRIHVHPDQMPRMLTAG